MTKSKLAPLANAVPWSTSLTEYDEAHFVVYLRLLDASAKGASDEDMLGIILETDPGKSHDEALRSMRSHLERARWMTTDGYRGLIAE